MSNANMKNPFNMFPDKDDSTEAESRKLQIRTGVLIGLFAAILLTFVAVLYVVQIRNGDSYLANANYNVAEKETVNSDRGDIVDRYGRVLVTNAISYNITLDTTLMGKARNAILAELTALCRDAGVGWADSLPISTGAPWTYTKDSQVFFAASEKEDGTLSFTYTRLGNLAKQCKWLPSGTLSEEELRTLGRTLGILSTNNQPIPEEMRTAGALLKAEAELSAEDLLRAMCVTFGLLEKDSEEPVSEEMRAVAGVLYELYLRTYEILYTDYIFARDVDISLISRIKERSLVGVSVDIATSRQYNTSVAAHILGRVAAIDPEDWPAYREQGYPMNATVGRGGIELAFESVLRGTSGVREIETDERGNLITQQWLSEPEPGRNVVLTIDSALQTTTEDLLAQFVSQLEHPDGAAAVVLDMTGGVLAMASHPTYNLSTFAEDFAQLSQSAVSPYYNRATHGTYAPGSTFKMVTATAALEQEVITPRSTVQCTGIYTHYPDARPRCWIYPYNHASENVSEAITDSCNIFFYDVGRRLGITALVEYASQFGLGQLTGIEIGESKGHVAGPDTSAHYGQTWYGGNTMYASIGQENNKFTPVQLANYIATLVNGGNHYNVHLLKEIKSADYSEVLETYDPVLLNTITIAPNNLAAIKKGMYDLSKTASMAQYFSALPVEVGCKTGTAEVDGKEATAVFVCFAPYDDPQIAICLVAEQGASGGNLASVAAGILAQYFSTNNSLSLPTEENTLLH